MKNLQLKNHYEHYKVQLFHRMIIITNITLACIIAYSCSKLLGVVSFHSCSKLLGVVSFHYIVVLERMSRHNMKVPEWQLPVPVNALTDITPCQFTMCHFSLHKSGQKTWYSPPFYNEPGGYKFCLRVDSHGMLEGKSTHLSVWVYVMKGLHDEALKWPFTGRVTVQLLNWKSDRGHVQNVIAFDDHAGDKVRQRVTAGECAATGRGSSKFVSHETLAAAGGNTEFVKDDCLCFKIAKVDIS